MPEYGDLDDLTLSGSGWAVGDPIRKVWLQQVNDNSANHEERLTDAEESVSDHEDRIDLLEGTGPSAERVFVSTTTLTDAQLKALPTTGQVLVAAPGSNYRIKVHSVTYYSWFQNGTYTNIDADAWMVIGVEGGWLGGIIANSSGDSLTKLTTFLESATPLCVDAPPYIEDDGGGWVTASVTNQTSLTDNRRLEIALDNQGSGDLTGGHTSNTLTVVVYYSLEAVPAYYMPFSVPMSLQSQQLRKKGKHQPGRRRQFVPGANQ